MVNAQGRAELGDGGKGVSRCTRDARREQTQVLWFKPLEYLEPAPPPMLFCQLLSPVLGKQI